MGKPKLNNDLQKQRVARPLLAVSLAASLAAFGCTTNQNLGNGTPTRSGPDVRTAPTSGVTSGGETTSPPPMTSSYTRAEVLPSVTQRTIRRRSPDEAAAIMAGGVQPARGRYLGVVSPGTPGRGYQSDSVQTFVPPALQTNPQLTINATISSNPLPAVSSGAGGDIGAAAGDVFADGATTAGAVVINNDITPTAAGAGLAIGTVAGSTSLPTFASANVPSVTAASVGAGRLGGGFGRGVTTGRATTATTAASTTTATTTTAATTTAATTATGARGGALNAPVRVLRGTSGVTVTNVGTTGTTTGTTTSGRSQ